MKRSARFIGWLDRGEVVTLPGDAWLLRARHALVELYDGRQVLVVEWRLEDEFDLEAAQATLWDAVA